MKPCPSCKTINDTNFYATYQNGMARDHHVRCDNCKICGPKSPTAQAALNNWDSMVSGGGVK